MIIAVPLAEGVEARISTRRGGVSADPWQSLNLGLHVGDRPQDVRENRRRWLAAMGRSAESLVTVKQVHGTDVYRADDPASGHTPGERPSSEGVPCADALTTTDPAHTLVIFTADCVPVLLADPHAGAVAVAHAGWRGTVGCVAQRTVESMVRWYGADPGRIRAWLGPHIRACCYEVDEPVIRRVQQAFPGHPELLRPGPPGKAQLDLAAVNLLALQAAGIDPRHVGQTPECTACRTDLFYSHRAERGQTGRMATAIWLSPNGGQ